MNYLRGCGIDIGGSLTKIAVVYPGEELIFNLLPEHNCQQVVDYVLKLGVQFCGVTGSGASEFKLRLRNLEEAGQERIPQVFCVNEFVAWGTGVGKLLPTSSGVELPYLLGSIGTGTSILLVNGFTITRVGGTALGGGTICGLGRLLWPGRTFEELCQLAERGKRSKVDLLLQDIYAPGQVGISGHTTASNFGRLASESVPRPPDSDLMAGIMGMVGENISLIASGFMPLARTHTIVYAGSTLRHNPALERVLTESAQLLNHRAVILERGEFTGAVGAYQLGLSSWSLYQGR